MGIAEEKKHIRTEMKRLRVETVESHKAESDRIVSKLMALKEWDEARTILLYSPIDGEVDCSPLLHTKGKRIVLPVVCGDELVLRTYSSTMLKNGYMGIMEPSEEAEEMLPEQIDLAIVPGVAFDKEGHRLGRGKGFYDRLLPKLKCPAIGLAFSCQMVEHIPVERHDVALDRVISPLP